MADNLSGSVLSPLGCESVSLSEKEGGGEGGGDVFMDQVEREMQRKCGGHVLPLREANSLPPPASQPCLQLNTRISLLLSPFLRTQFSAGIRIAIHFRHKLHFPNWVSILQPTHAYTRNAHAPTHASMHAHAHIDLEQMARNWATWNLARIWVTSL